MRIINSNWQAKVVTIADKDGQLQHNGRECKNFNMRIFKTNCFKLLLFQTSMKARVMGKRPTCYKCMMSLPFKIQLHKLMSHTIIHEFGKQVNFYKTKQLHLQNATTTTTTARYIEHEPELFPAMRFLAYKPVCVNVFRSGKVMLLGVKSEQHAWNIVMELETKLVFDMSQ